MNTESIIKECSRDIAAKLGVEVDSKITAIFFKSKKELAEAFVKYSKERSIELGKELPSDPPSYLVGFNPTGKYWYQAWVLLPSKIDNDTTMDQGHFEKLLKHEMTHAYVKLITGKRSSAGQNVPSWLDEGIAYWVTGQIPRDLEGEITINRLRDLSKTFNTEKFAVGLEMVNRILKSGGERKLIEILKISPDQEKLEKELRNMFEWLK